MEEPTITELLNKIEFLKKALEFYANKKNYVENIPIATSIASQIELDEGEQARFALEQIEDIQEYNKTLLRNYHKVIDQIKEQMDEPNAKQLNKIETIEELIKKYGDKNI